MASFGHTSIGGLADTVASDRQYASNANLPVAGRLTKVSAYLSGGSVAQTLRAVIYSSPLSSPSRRVAATETVTVGVSQASGWVDFPFVGQAVDLDAGNFWLSLHGGTSADGAIYRYATAPKRMHTIPDTFADAPLDPWNAGASQVYDRKLSVYVTFTALDVWAPEVEITSPADGATVSGTFGIDVAAYDDVGVSGVQVFLDGVSLGQDLLAPYSFSFNSVAAGIVDGSHVLSAEASDLAGNVGRHAITAVFANAAADVAAPTCSVASIGPA